MNGQLWPLTAITTLTGGNDVHYIIMAPLYQGDNVILRQNLRAQPAVRTSVAPKPFEFAPLRKRERSLCSRLTRIVASFVMVRTFPILLEPVSSIGRSFRRMCVDIAEATGAHLGALFVFRCVLLAPSFPIPRKERSPLTLSVLLAPARRLSHAPRSSSAVAFCTVRLTVLAKALYSQNLDTRTALRHANYLRLAEQGKALQRLRLATARANLVRWGGVMVSLVTQRCHGAFSIA